jgi:hypothetical protein
VAARAPLPPRGALRGETPDGVVLRILPAEASGEILVAAAPGEVFSRHAVPQQPGAAGRVFDLHLALAPGDTQVWLAHETPDGRRSAWRSVALDPDEPGGTP